MTGSGLGVWFRPVWTGKLSLAPEHVLLEPLKRRKPTMWFVNSMSDLFHEDVRDEWIDRVFAVMALCPQHTFQVLTKRSGRMRAGSSGMIARCTTVCPAAVSLVITARPPLSVSSVRVSRHSQVGSPR